MRGGDFGFFCLVFFFITCDLRIYLLAADIQVIYLLSQ